MVSSPRGHRRVRHEVVPQQQQAIHKTKLSSESSMQFLPACDPNLQLTIFLTQLSTL